MGKSVNLQRYHRGISVWVSLCFFKETKEESLCGSVYASSKKRKRNLCVGKSRLLLKNPKKNLCVGKSMLLLKNPKKNLSVGLSLILLGNHQGICEFIHDT